MRAVLALTWSAPWRAAGRPRAQQVTTTALAVLAFAVTTAFGLSVLGGLMGFSGRAADPASAVIEELAPAYVQLAWIAVVLLVVPLAALGGAAARLGVARRDARLSTLRLLGVTPREVVGLTVLETAGQAVVGALLGVAGYGLLMPVWTRIPFMGEPFTAGELWVGWLGLLGVLAAVPLLAAGSAAVSLRRVVVSPLGVARRVTPPGLRWVRAVAVVGAVGGFVLLTQVNLGFQAAVVAVLLIVMLGAVFGTLALVGPWVIGLLGRGMARAARTPATLLAGRRLVDDPKGAWRVVGGLALASFVAGCLSVVPAMAQVDSGDDPAGRLLLDDVVTGGMLTLGIAFAVAACSAGIFQAASVLDRRDEYARQRLAGAPVELFDSVRRREVVAPLLLVSLVSGGVAIVLLVPVFGLSGATDVSGLVTLAVCIAVGLVAVLAATETSRPLLRAVLREPVVRVE